MKRVERRPKAGSRPSFSILHILKALRALAEWLPGQGISDEEAGLGEGRH